MENDDTTKPIKPVQPSINAVSPQKATESKGAESPENPSLGTKIEPTPEAQKQAHYCKPEQTPRWKMVLESAAVFIGIVVAIIYGLQLSQMVESNNINRENMESVQRALVSFTGQTPVVKRLTRKKVTSLTMVIPWENTGVTPAMNGKSVVNWKTLPSPNGLPEDFTYPDQKEVEPRQFEIRREVLATALWMFRLDGFR